MKKRDLSLDIIRIVACALVVLMHSPIPSSDAPGVFLTGLSYVTAPCIGLFFMVSGALLLDVNEDYFSFLRRRFAKIVSPLVFWTAVYLGLKLCGCCSGTDILRSVASIPFSAQGHGVLWFMYTLAGLYLLAPILGAWLRGATTREIEFVLFQWGESLCYPLLEHWLDINTGTTGLLYYFSGYAGYFLLGYYLKHRRAAIPWQAAATVASLGAGLAVVLKMTGTDFDFYRLFWYESVFVAALCCAIWHLLTACASRIQDARHSPGQTGGGIHQAINTLANLSFGIYLMHILVMRQWLWQVDWIRGIQFYPLQTAVVAMLTLTVTTIMSLLLSMTPMSTFIIGYRQRKNRDFTT